MNIETIPLLIIALLMISAGGAGIETTELMIEGEHEITEHDGALIVGDATVTVPADESISGPVYIIGGELQVQGSIEDDVTQLAGILIVESSGSIDGEFQHIGGTKEIAGGALIVEQSTLEFTPADPDPVAAYTPIVVMTVVLAIAGAWLSRTHQHLLNTVGSAARNYPVISLSVGTLLAVTFLVLFVFMAFTLVLLPVSIIGLLAGMLVIAYGIIALGYLIGQQIDTSRSGLATALGIVAVMMFLQVIGILPVLGDIIAIGLLLIGLGAVIITYFGLQEFEPVSLPG
ncbi:hypothetical protein K0C01_10255 [Salinarchaeum sp. IM2453]|uniref:hypothetical protein n=1 Tax=Salinarchaeum sp. IM2453 TaxID=2862870 RepID=UPI001C82B6B0|nr:hypothetical protein [Salinarchaeum sp. IM2453]QZA88166.1 hypothetical protein K0C01_10255 [Salinarchaeum sp. IM2453]